MEEKPIRVACPCCRNKRLFDVDPGTVGTIMIKCLACRQVIAVSFHEGKGKSAARMEAYAAR